MRWRGTGRRWWVVAAMVVVLAAAGTVTGVLLHRGDSGPPVDAASTAELERVAADPAQARALLDPGDDGKNEVLSVLLSKPTDGAAVLAEADPPLKPYPSDAAIGDAIKAAAGDPADPAARRIAETTIADLDADDQHGGSVRSGMRHQVADMLMAYLVDDASYGDKRHTPPWPTVGPPLYLLRDLAHDGDLNDRLTAAVFGAFDFTVAEKTSVSGSVENPGQVIYSHVYAQADAYGVIVADLAKGRYQAGAGRPEDALRAILQRSFGLLTNTKVPPGSTPAWLVNQLVPYAVQIATGHEPTVGTIDPQGYLALVRSHCQQVFALNPVLDPVEQNDALGAFLRHLS